MARVSDTATFNTKTYRDTVATMRARRERVHDAGERVYRETGRLDPNVDIHGNRRLSRNSMVRDGDHFILKNGIALPIFSGFDGTGSMGGNVAKAFEAIPVIDTMLAGIRHRYNTQIASAVVQDVVDTHPVFQMSQFESDIRIAEQIRLLVPDHGGGDETEDYDLCPTFLWLATQTDISDFYGLKGYAMIVGDQIGRGTVTAEGVKEYLGHTLQTRSMATKAICQALLPKWHIFYVHVGSGGGGSRDFATDWWTDKLGQGRGLIVPDPDLLAEVQAGLIYTTETLDPTESGMIEFLLSGGANKRITEREAREVWKWIKDAGIPFGAQAKLPGYNEIPKPGDVFAHLRHAWPEGHPRASENVTPTETGEGEVAALPAETPTKKTGKPIDWNKF